MLKEIKTTNNTDQDMTKRWFNDESMDLIVWKGPDGEFEKFQLCYDKHRNEHALTWVRSKGFVHNAIDDGETNPGGHKRTPILTPDGKIDIPSIVTRFESQASSLDNEIIEFVSEKLNALSQEE